jgi:hypothetical protein
MYVCMHACISMCVYFTPTYFHISVSIDRLIYIYVYIDVIYLSVKTFKYNK